MDSENNKKDVEFAKKSCEKARELIKSKRRAALALLASIGICLTLVVVTFVIGSLFGYYLANVQMLRIEQNVVREGKVKTNLTICEMQKLAQQLEQKVENNLTPTSTTTQISTNTRTPATDEESIGSKIQNYFDSDENDETEKVNVNPKEHRIDAEKTPSWDEILVNSETLEKLEPDSDAQPISTSASNQEDLTQTEFDDELKALNTVFKATENDEPEDYDNANNDQEDDNVDKESISLELTTQKPNFLETITQKPNTLKFEFTPGPLVYDERIRIYIERMKLTNKFHQFINDIFQCPGVLSLECSVPAHRMDIIEQRKHMESIIYQAFEFDEHHQLDSARIENAHRQLDEIFDRIRSTPVDLCADHSDYDKCQSCVQQKADCLYSFKDTCKSQIEWNIIGHLPKLVDQKQCYTEQEISYRRRFYKGSQML